MSRPEDLFFFPNTHDFRNRQERARNEGFMAAIKEGIRIELQPFQQVWNETMNILGSVKPRSISYPTYPKDVIPVRNSVRTINATISWDFAALHPLVEDPVDVAITTEATVQGTMKRETPDDDLVYALWYLQDYSIIHDRKLRRSPLPVRTLLDIPVSRQHTNHLQQKVAEKLLQRTKEVNVTVSQPEQIGVQSKIIHTKSPQELHASFTSCLQYANAQSIYEAVQRGLQNDQTYDYESVEPDTEASYFDAVSVRIAMDRLDQINALLQRNGYSDN